MRIWTAILLLGSMLTLQGCVAALLPLAAAGAIGKTQVDAAKRAERAQDGMEEIFAKTGKPVVVVGPPDATEQETETQQAGPQQAEVYPLAGADASAQTGQAPADPSLHTDEARAAVAAALSSANIVNISAKTSASLPPADPVSKGSSLNLRNPHPYSGFARFALEQAERQGQGLAVSSAILIEKISLFAPETIGCRANPLAVIIDLDAAASGSSTTEKPLAPLGDILSEVRDAGVRIIWMSDRSQAALDAAIEPLRMGKNPAIQAEDLISLGEARGQKKGLRKQERRWQLARYYCIAAIAGDANADFDELFNYLRNPDFAISLNRFWDKGWFKLPDPVSIAAPRSTANIK